VQVNESGVGTLVSRGYLLKAARSDPAAIKAAVGLVISDLASDLYQKTSKGERISLLRLAK
jgi:hypothetical protein